MATQKTTLAISDLKKRALLAKQRMRMGYWQSVQEKREKKLAELGVDNSETIELVRDMQKAQIRREGNLALGSNQEIQDEALYEKVCALLSSTAVITNPLATLIDKELYDSMDESNKQRYILQLSKKFCTMKARYYSELELVGVQ